jgi:hypothetical protein
MKICLMNPKMKKILKNMNFLILILRKILRYMRNRLQTLKNSYGRFRHSFWMELNTVLMNLKEYYTFSAYY